MNIDDLCQYPTEKKLPVFKAKRLDNKRWVTGNIFEIVDTGSDYRALAIKDKKGKVHDIIPHTIYRKL